jgi:septum formation protein
MFPKHLNQFHFILASKSPRRQFLLHELGIKFDLETKEVDESFPEHLMRDEIPLYLCRKKADAFEGKLDEKTIVITADTIVWINNHVLNKPVDAEDAKLMLRELSGNRHEVYTGVCLKSAKKEIAFAVKTDVYFKELSEAEIDFYVSAYKPFDKAGAYGAQECLPPGENPCSDEEIFFLESLGRKELIERSKTPLKGDTGKMIVEKIEGSYFNVMGLPVKELWEEIEKF